MSQTNIPTKSLILTGNIELLKDTEEKKILGSMPASEKRSIEQNRRHEDRKRRILARLLLAQGVYILKNWNLRETLNAFRRDVNGRPWVQGLGRALSLSHSGQWAVCAIAGVPRTCIGVDVEKIQTLPIDDFQLAFTECELLHIRKAKNPPSELIRRWTIKEAVLKAKGTGLLADPQRIVTGVGTQVHGEPFFVSHVPLEQGYWMTVAESSRAEIASPRCLTFTSRFW